MASHSKKIISIWYCNDIELPNAESLRRSEWNCRERTHCLLVHRLYDKVQVLLIVTTQARQPDKTRDEIGCGTRNSFSRQTVTNVWSLRQWSCPVTYYSSTQCNFHCSSRCRTAGNLLLLLLLELLFIPRILQLSRHLAGVRVPDYLSVDAVVLVSRECHSPPAICLSMLCATVLCCALLLS